MDYRRLGTSDIEVSVVGLGGNTFGPPRIDEPTTTEVISRALEFGVNFIDTAISYGQGQSEVFIGNALRGRRSDVVIATKFQLGDVAAPGRVRQQIAEQAEQSLRKLQTDYVDLLQIHLPAPDVPTYELLGALDELVVAGKARAIGCSNYSGWRLAESAMVARMMSVTGFVTVQNHYSLLHRHPERELVQACGRYSVGLIPYHPLGGGFLTGKYRRGEPPPAGSRGAAGSPIVNHMSTEQNWEIIAALETFAHERGHTLGELAIAWLVAKRTVTSVITGVSSVDQLGANVAGAGWELTTEEKSIVDDISATGAETRAEGYVVSTSPRSPTTTR